MKLARFTRAAGLMAGLVVSTAYAKAPQERPVLKYKADDPAVRSTDGILPPPQVRAPADIKGPKPIIKPEVDVHDFGTVWTGPDLLHSFTLTNAGDKALEISAVRPSCGCTIAGTYPKKLAPGESGEFPFKMNSGKLRGNFAKHITITSNDPITPNLRLTLRGDVRQHVDVTPATASFGRITDQEPKTRELMITNNSDGPLELEMKPQTGDPFEYKLNTVEKGRRYSLQITAKPPFTEGSMSGNMVLATNVEKQKEIIVRTVATVPPRIEILPNAIMLSERGEVNSGRPISRIIRYTNFGDKPAKLLEATVDDPAVTVDVRERKEGEAYTVEVQLPAGYMPPPEGRTIVLKTDDAEKPEFRVPITGPRRPTQTAKVERPKPEDMIGKPAPAFALKTVDGKALSSDTVRESVTVLNFMAANCGFCKKQIPRLEPVRQKYENRGVRFVNVSQKMGAREYSESEISELIKGLGFNGELAINHDNTVGSMFNASGFPTMVVIGTDGKVAAVNVGNVGDLESKLSGQIDSLVAGKPGEPQVALAAQTPEPARVAPPPAPRVRPDDLVGKPAPAFMAKTIDGKELSSDTIRKDTATVLNFFAVNCGFCKKQIPRLESIRKDFEGKGVRFVNVAETMRQEFTEDQIAATLREVGWNDEWVRDPKNEIGPLFGASGFPTMVIVGKSGNVEAVNIGNIADLETRVKGQLTALVEGKPIPQDLAKAPAQAPTPSPNDWLGKQAPAFALKTIDGKDISNATCKESAATVLNFYAPNCGYCKKQIPRLETVRKDYADKNVRFVNVTMTMGKPFSVDETTSILKELGWTDEIAQDPSNQVGPKFGVTGFPTMVVVGKDGTVQAVHIGNVGNLETALKSQLDSLIAGKNVAQAAPPGAPPAAPSQPRRRPAEDMVGQPAPNFTLTTMDGKSVTSKDFGKHSATVLNFVAPNCGFCKRQMPNVEKVRSEFESKGVRFVNVAMKMGSKEFPDDEIHKIFKDAGSNIEIAKDPNNQVGQSFKAQSFPTLFVVDKTGKIAHVTIGAKADLETTLRGELSEMVK